MAPVDQDLDEELDPALADLDFQAYIANAWATFQADRKDKGKRVQFDGIEMPARKTGRPGPQAVLVAEEVILLVIEAMQSKSATPPRVPAPVANRPLSSTSLLRLTWVEANIDLKDRRQRFLKGVFKKMRVLGAPVTTPGNYRLHREFEV